MLYERNMKVSNLINVDIIMINKHKWVKISQNLIDKCPFEKYTYSSLKHILEIGFKAPHYGGINLK